MLSNSNFLHEKLILNSDNCLKNIYIIDRTALFSHRQKRKEKKKERDGTLCVVTFSGNKTGKTTFCSSLRESVIQQKPFLLVYSTVCCNLFLLTTMLVILNC